MTENLTLERIRLFTCPSGKEQAFLRDAEVPQLAVRATWRGAKSYIFESKLKGKTLRLTIGSVKTLLLDSKTPAGARQIARLYQGMIDSGRDPRQVKAELTASDVAAREEARRKDVIALDAWQAYIEERREHWSEKHIRDNEDAARQGGEKITRGRRPGMKAKREPGILRPVLLLPLSQITDETIKGWVKTNHGRRPVRTRLALSFLGTFFRWCEESKDYRGNVSESALKACATEKRKMPQAGARTDCLQREQLPTWFDHVKRLPPVVSAYLQIGLLTGARREELAGLRWDDVDMQWDSLTIRDKVEGHRTIPLTPYAKGLILELRALNNREPSVRYLKTLQGRGEEWKPSEYVFFSKRAKGGRITEPNIALSKVTTAAGLPDLSMHGLRRSFKSLSEWCEVPAGVVAQIMGHKPSAIAEKHYTVRPLDLLRKWHAGIEAWVLSQAGIALPAVGKEGAGLKVVSG